MTAMYLTGYAAMCASEYGVASSAIGPLCIQSRCDHFRCCCARASGAADGRCGWIRNIANRKYHRRACLLLAAYGNETLRVHLQLLADQLSVWFYTDANQQPANSQLKRFQSIFTLNFHSFHVIAADDTRQH